MMDVETEFYEQDISKREPLLHLAVKTGNLAVVEVEIYHHMSQSSRQTETDRWADWRQTCNIEMLEIQ